MLLPFIRFRDIMTLPFALIVMAHLRFQENYFPVVYMYFNSKSECMSKLLPLITDGSTPRGACLRTDWMKEHDLTFPDWNTREHKEY